MVPHMPQAERVPLVLPMVYWYPSHSKVSWHIAAHSTHREEVDEVVHERLGGALREGGSAGGPLLDRGRVGGELVKLGFARGTSATAALALAALGLHERHVGVHVPQSAWWPAGLVET